MNGIHHAVHIKKQMISEQYILPPLRLLKNDFASIINVISGFIFYRLSNVKIGRGGVESPSSVKKVFLRFCAIFRVFTSEKSVAFLLCSQAAFFRKYARFSTCFFVIAGGSVSEKGCYKTRNHSFSPLWSLWCC